MDEQRLGALAAELGLTVDDLRDAQSDVTAGVPDALLGGLIRFEDALFELSV